MAEMVTVQIPRELYEMLKRFSQFTVSDSTGKTNFSSTTETVKEEIPTLNDVVDEVKRIASPVSALRFFNYYQAKGWVDTKGNTFNWKQKLVEWGSYNLERPVHDTTAQKHKVFVPTRADIEQSLRDMAEFRGGD